MPILYPFEDKPRAKSPARARAMGPIVTISAPSSRDVGQSFVTSGILYESTTGEPIIGVNVFLYRDPGDIFLGAAVTGIDGDYLKTTSIGTAGTWTLTARYGVAYDTTTITITEPEEPEPYWEFVETYRWIDIEVYMPDGTPYRAYYDGKWDVNYDIDDIKAGIDAFLGPEEPEPIQCHIFDIQYWYGGMSQWQEVWPIDEYVPPPMGYFIWFQPRWRNDSSVTVTGHMDLEVTSPSGVKYNPSAYSGQDTIATPGGYGFPRFNYVLLNESGVWTLKATLTCDDVLCDERTITFTIEEVLVVSLNITDVETPSELDEGEIPQLTVHLTTLTSEQIQAYIKIYDISTGALVCETNKFYLTTGTYEVIIAGTSWLTTMPEQDWNLRVAILEWWP